MYDVITPKLPLTEHFSVSLSVSQLLYSKDA